MKFNDEYSSPNFYQIMAFAIERNLESYQCAQNSCFLQKKSKYKELPGMRNYKIQKKKAKQANTGLLFIL
jgi:hypothetical protein